MDDFVNAYLSSNICQACNAELEQHLASQELRANQTNEFREVVKNEQAKSVSSSSPFTASLWVQVQACTVQQYQLMWNDKGEPFFSLLCLRFESVFLTFSLSSFLRSLLSPCRSLF